MILQIDSIFVDLCDHDFDTVFSLVFEVLRAVIFDFEMDKQGCQI